jgi:EAL domain-containing protein (putative c-di-GMP-specific phosphodiesterase class I)
VAEGVETPEQLAFLRLHKCDLIQGFLFSKAVPAKDFAALVRAGPMVSGTASP